MSYMRVNIEITCKHKYRLIVLLTIAVGYLLYGQVFMYVPHTSYGGTNVQLL